LVVKGYEQIPGVDFTETFSPVAGDTTIRTVLATAMYLGWSCKAIDVEAAFLNADLDEDVYVEIPQGYDSGGSKNQVYKLLKAVYGIVQAPRCWSKTFTKSLITKGLEPSKVDPCLFILRENGEKSPIIGLLVNYVDDGIVVGSKLAIEIIKSKIKEDFTISELGPLKKHLGVNYTWKTDGIGSFWEVQMKEFRRDLIKDYLEATNAKKVKPSATPGTPGRTLVKNKGDAVMESKYRKMVGKLLWTVKKESPDCANAVRELSAHLSNPGRDQWDAVTRIVGFLAHNEERVLKMRTPTSMRVTGYVDSDWAANKDTRKSTTGFLVTIGGCLVSWQSKAQPSVTLSSTEAEYVALSMCAQEIKFIMMLLDEIAANFLETPSILREDNTGAIFTAKNQQIGARTKHIDVKHHHVKDMLQAGELELLFVKSEENFADLMTKNVREGIHSLLSGPLMNGTMATAFDGCDEEDVKNLVATGLNSGLDKPNPSSSNDDWTRVVRRNPKAVNLRASDKGRTVTWADIARSKVGLSFEDKSNGNKPKKKDSKGSWNSQRSLGKGRKYGLG
jgi:hypothetical protein